MRTRYLLAATVGALSATTVADSTTFSIDAHVLSAGSAVHTSSACFGMDAVISDR
jgi:hypothetical protein